jgi:hypothetical protein
MDTIIRWRMAPFSNYFFHHSLRFLLLIWFGLSLILPAPIERIPKTGLTASLSTAQFLSQLDIESVEKIKNAFPSLAEFTAELENGEGDTLRGVYVPGILALPVIEQPEGDLGYVSKEARTVTEFQSATQYNVIGLLAHNYLAGKAFFGLSEGHEVFIIYGDGKTIPYLVTGTYEYQKLNPGSLRSYYRNLIEGERLSTRQLFNLVYRGPHHVTFQTCIARNGELEWGLRFVVAEPVIAFK